MHTHTCSQLSPQGKIPLPAYSRHTYAHIPTILPPPSEVQACLPMFTDIHTEPYHTTSHTHLTPKLQRGHRPRFTPILPPPAPSLFSQGECGHCTPYVHPKFCPQDSNPADPRDWGLRPGPRETQQGAGLPPSSEFAPGAQTGGGARRVYASQRRHQAPPRFALLPLFLSSFPSLSLSPHPTATSPVALGPEPNSPFLFQVLLL